MYMAFNLKDLNEFEQNSLKRIDDEEAETFFHEKAKQVQNNFKMIDLLESSTIYDKVDGLKINADKVQQNIFPVMNDFDVFISHSHKDMTLVKKLAYFLHKEMGINAFIDSFYWGYADDLLERANKNFAYNGLSSGDVLFPNGTSGKLTVHSFNMEKANINACNIYLMLSNALREMIDKTEVLFFVNTPNSINPDANINYQDTSSPWIFDEIKTVATIRRNKPARFNTTYRFDSMDNIRLSIISCVKPF